MKSKFNITENNIKNGKQADPANCAIAQAVKREMKKQGVKIKNVSVLPYDIRMDIFNSKTNKISHLSAVMPEHGANFIKKFDSGEKVKPFVLEVSFKKA